MALHPQARTFLDAMAEQDAPGWEQLTPTESREVFSGLTDLFGDGPTVARVEDRVSDKSISVRLYWPSGDGPFPAVVYFHGGGWVLGDLDTHDALCRRMANRSSAVVVSVDYQRSPEAAFPSAIEDCYAATQYVADQAEGLRVDPNQIIVAGDSAGGNLAAAVAIMARDREGPKICLQVLVYPVLDHRCETDSYRDFAEGFGLTKASMQWFWQQYLGPDGDGSNPLASPLLADEFAGLPQTHIITAEYDVLRDEGEQYVNRLKESGVPTTHRRYDGMIHGFVQLAGVFDVGRDAVDDIATVIRDVTTRNRA